MKRLSILLLLYVQTLTFAQSKQDIQQALEQKDFFKAKTYYTQVENTLSEWEQKYFQAILNNAFNKVDLSYRQIVELLNESYNLPNNIQKTLYLIQMDNEIKLYEYAKAAQTIHQAMTQFEQLFSPQELSDLHNSYKIWSALAHEPKQEVHIAQTTDIVMVLDKAGLKNLQLTDGEDTVNFIFDTGANISTVNEETAKRLNMKIIPAEIEVGTITGQTINANLAVCPYLKMGAVEIFNAVFLVFSNESMSFPQIDYRINGILGFPIINALKEVQITHDNHFIVPKEETVPETSSNLALNGLEPIIWMNDMHFTFDTGATESILYCAFYNRHKPHFPQDLNSEKFSFGGAAGVKEFTGYSIDCQFDIYDKQAKLKGVKVLVDKIKDDETVYGNIGQDLIKQFSKMTLNFDKMFVKFD